MKKRYVIDTYKEYFVILDSKELKTKRPYKKLDNVRYDIYKIKKLLSILY